EVGLERVLGLVAVADADPGVGRVERGDAVAAGEAVPQRRHPAVHEQVALTLDRLERCRGQVVAVELLQPPVAAPPGGVVAAHAGRQAASLGQSRGVPHGALPDMQRAARSGGPDVAGWGMRPRPAPPLNDAGPGDAPARPRAPGARLSGPPWRRWGFE